VGECLAQGGSRPEGPTADVANRNLKPLLPFPPTWTLAPLELPQATVTLLYTTVMDDLHCVIRQCDDTTEF
jgi:hypothetical protein